MMTEIIVAEQHTASLHMMMNPIMDTTAFQQMMSIADIMANTSLIPETLMVRDKAPLPIETVRANCFLIVNQAIRWGLDPFAVAQCSSVVHGRLMFEGKLVAGVLQSRLGVKLKYEFGKWDKVKECTIVGVDASGDDLAIRVSEDLGDGKISSRFIDGHVGGWKTTGSNTPWRPGNFRKMLGYRGAREWARVFEPGVMLGVVTDDEVDFHNMRNITPAEPVVEQTSGSDLIATLKAAQSQQAGANGFNKDHFAEQATGVEASAQKKQEGNTISNGPSAEDDAVGPQPTSSSSNTKAAAHDSSQAPAAEDGDSPLSPSSPIAEDTSAIIKAKLIECGFKFMELAGGTDFDAPAKRGVLAGLKDVWKKEIPTSHHNVLQTIVRQCDDVIRGKIDRQTAVKYLAGILRCDEKQIGGAA